MFHNLLRATEYNEGTSNKENFSTSLTVATHSAVAVEPYAPYPCVVSGSANTTANTSAPSAPSSAGLSKPSLAPCTSTEISEGAKGYILDTLEELLGTVEDIERESRSCTGSDGRGQIKGSSSNRTVTPYSEFVDVGNLVLGLLQ